MKELVTIGYSLLLGLVANAQTNVALRSRSHADPLRSRYAAMERMGGCFAMPESQKGSIRFVNTQTELPIGEIMDVEHAICKFDKYKVEFKNAPTNSCLLELVNANRDAGVMIAVVSDDKTSPILVAPDEHWAIVNIRTLRNGLATDEAVTKFFASRCRKQLIRAYVLACTGNGSQYSKNFFYNTNVSDFDLYNEFIPMDSATRCKEFLARRGVLPIRYVTYMKACREGWAPAPTNDVQKAIWDKVHAIPKAPMKIEYDSKKGR